MQTILGAGGSIGVGLVRELYAHTDKVRLVSRNPQKFTDKDELFQADLLKTEEVDKAIEGSEVVYLVAGMPYRLKAWRVMWPQVMQNTIDACKAHQSKLVFFDNLYMYDKSNLDPALETAKINPPSQKGRVRTRIVEMLEKEMKAGNLKALIARAPDFYGPGIRNAVLNEAVFKPLKEGKKANWFCSVRYVHSFIWTPDAAKATAMLGNDESAYGETWHLPTSEERLTGKDFIEMISKELNRKPATQVAGHVLVRLLGLFDPVMREFSEMLYQYDRDYFFDCKKFMGKYDFKVTPYEEGIRRMIAAEND